MNDSIMKNRSEIRFFHSGDRALTMEFGTCIDVEISRQVLTVEHSLERERVPGVLETVPSYSSLLVCYDPLQVSYDALCRILKKRLREDVDGNETEYRVWEIPCCYGLYFGRDLDRVAEHAGLRSEEVVERHCGVEYRIYMLGFLPGFVYLGGLDRKLQTPRLSIPRARIPRGSVGIGGSQTGIYPLPSPGGWNLIGCTPVELYDPESDEPVLCRAGDHIRFLSISNREYYDIRQEVIKKAYRVRSTAVKEAV